ncbi:hypothetical protein CEXT_216921 [Caerostris extrusa]|uniref:Uncharacterized protein n=1 Tax=Caerostris extrusa TaxID=172846 RepID=A0AAV4NFI5_CAEEX|nr:hypothetical protein CEXT_216921 [Caerostris extrusa]
MKILVVLDRICGCQILIDSIVEFLRAKPERVSTGAIRNEVYSISLRLHFVCQLQFAWLNLLSHVANINRQRMPIGVAQQM